MKDKLIKIFIETKNSCTVARKGGLLGLSACIVRDHIVVGTIGLKINPTTYNRKNPRLSAYMIKAQGLTLEEVQKYPDSNLQFKIFLEFLRTHINNHEYYQMITYSQRDGDFVEGWFMDNLVGFNPLFSDSSLNLKVLSSFFNAMGVHNTRDDNLSTLMEQYKIEKSLESLHNLYRKMQRLMF